VLDMDCLAESSLHMFEPAQLVRQIDSLLTVYSYNNYQSRVHIHLNINTKHVLQLVDAPQVSYDSAGKSGDPKVYTLPAKELLC
jgi:hypothetical protein